MRLPFLLAALLVTSCQPDVPVEHHERIAGIEHSLWIMDKDRQKAKRAADAVFSELRLLSGFTHPTESKPISRINVLLRSREWFSVNPSLTGILQQSAEYYRKTEGLYNPPGLGALRELWGWYGSKGPANTPKEADIQQLLGELPTMEDIHFEGIRLRGHNQRIRLDFDYLAYGYAVDMQLQHLQELGIKHARLKIQQVEKTIGTVPGAPLRSGLASCQRRVPVDTVRHEVIDPRTGHPIDQIREIQVTAGSAADASVACWALLVSDDESRRLLAGRLDIIEARIVDKHGRESHIKRD